MGTNFKEEAARFKVQSADSKEVYKINGSVITFTDGKSYVIHEPDENHPQSFLCVFDFASGWALSGSFPFEAIGENIADFKVDVKTDSEGNVVGLNPVNLENGEPPYDGVVITVVFNNLRQQARFKSSTDNPEIVLYDGIYSTGGELVSGVGEKLREKLNLPIEFNAVATAVNLLAEPKNVFELRKNPFI